MHYFTVNLCFMLLLNNYIVAQSNYGSAYLYSHKYPDDATPSWGDDDNGSSNGIAHDNSNWFISQTTVGDHYSRRWIIWRIPVTEPLDQDFWNNPSVSITQMQDVPVLANNFEDHAGDLVYCNHGNTGYVLVPMTGDLGACIVFFTADNLTYVNYELLPNITSVGWCAVNSEGTIVYTSDDNASSIKQYSINWSIINNTSVHNALSLSDSHPLKDLNGNSLLLHDMQGGEFDDHDEFLYISSGLTEFYFWGHCYPEDGLHVFSFINNTWKEVQRSINRDRPPYSPGYFDYTYDCSDTDEPEGLTYWDLDSGIAPYVSGQLHVLLMNHAAIFTERVSLLHYTKEVYVDWLWGHNPSWGFPLPGIWGFTSNSNAFNTLFDAYNWYPIWDGAEIVFMSYGSPFSNNYPFTGILNKRIRLVSKGGAITIGKND